MTDSQRVPAQVEARARGPLRAASIGIAVVVVGLMCLDAFTYAHPLVLPTLSIVLTIAGFAWAAVSAMRHRADDVKLAERMTGPALVLFVGFAAAMLSDTDQVVAHLQRLR